MKRFIPILALSLNLNLTGCPPGPVPPPAPLDATDTERPRPVDSSAEDSGAVDAVDANQREVNRPFPPVVEVCEEIVKHLLAIGCTPPSPKTGDFVDVCRVGRANGVFGTSCLFKAHTVLDVKKCGVTCLRDGGPS